MEAKHNTNKLHYFRRLTPQFSGGGPIRSVTAARLVVLLCAVAVELKNTTIWKGGFYFSSENGKVRVNAENPECRAGGGKKNRLSLKPHKKE